MNENEIIMENLDVVDDVIEVIPEKTGVNFGAIGLTILAVGAVAALGYKGYQLIKAKKAKKAQEAECAATVEANDFDEEEFAE